jgi:hypothetical protein
MGSKKTYVASAVYNMAGDIKDRPHYLKTMVAGRVLSGQPATESFTATSLRSYLKGPGIDLRHFVRWARLDGYNANLGEVQSTISVPNNINTTALSAQLELIYGKTLYLNRVNVGMADYGIWANQYMLANHQDKYTTAWAADFNEATGQIIIRIPMMSPITFTPVGYVQSAQYMYVSLNQEKDFVSSSETSGWLVGQVDVPDDYTIQSNQTNSVTVLLEDTTVVSQTLNGGVPYSSAFSNPHYETISLTSQLYTRKSNLPNIDSDLVVGSVTESIEIREVQSIHEKINTSTLTELVQAGTRISNTTSTIQTLQKHTEYQKITVTVREKSWANEEIFIYRQGSGNAALDALFVARSAAGSFFPAIPIRINNKFVTEPQYAGILPWVQKAVARSTNFTFEKLLDIVKDNPSLKDIDFAYMLFGVSLNSTENASKRYMYEFFRNAGQPSTAAMNQFWNDYWVAVASWDAWVQWYESGRYESNRYDWDNSMPTEPTRLPMPTLPKQGINVRSQYNYNLLIEFSGAVEELFEGKYSPSAKINTLRIYKGPTLNFRQYPQQSEKGSRAYQGYFLDTNDSAPAYQTVIIDWQYAHGAYRRLTITGLKHVNFVYGGKAVEITAWDALDDLEESGFIIPLQEETLFGLPLSVTTQLTTASTYMMFNSYQIVKQEWYQTGIFKVVLVIITIVLSIYFPPASGVTGGLLGTNVAIGTALGFTGTAAIIAGAIANAIVSMIVTEIISRASIALLGPRVGSIVGAILSIVVVSVGTSMAGGKPLSISFGNLINAENLMKLTSALSTGISAYIASGTQDTIVETQDVLEDYKRQAKSIAERYTQEFGDSSGVIDPLAVADAVQFQIEDPSIFLNRTLMNGTDIADLSHNMLDNFTTLTTALPLE